MLALPSPGVGDVFAEIFAVAGASTAVAAPAGGLARERSRGGLAEQRRHTPARIYEEHRDRVFHLCLRYGRGDAAWAEDATHDVFVRLLERLDALQDHDDLGGWVYRVATNTCLTRLKREGSVWSRVRRVVSAGRSTRDTDTPERKAQVRQGLSAALQMLETMPAKERVVFSMRYLDGVQQQRIAETLSLSKGYVSKLLARSRERLAKQGWEVPDDD